MLPLVRGLATNWRSGNRREAGIILSHIAGSGETAKSIVLSMSRVLKKIDPVRLLEAHMAGLRQDFDDWGNSEPEELDSDSPTDAEMQEYDQAEKAYKERVRNNARLLSFHRGPLTRVQFELLVLQASRLSASLGVGKLTDPKLKPSVLGFVREGVRIAFSTDVAGYEEDLPLGARLPFLHLMSKYVSLAFSQFGYGFSHGVQIPRMGSQRQRAPSRIAELFQ